jgi:guanylate kinase|tara:strand:- start:230 stop:871 length:642 start_codon:yes stop_codon:yes gene_type:complete
MLIRMEMIAMDTGYPRLPTDTDNGLLLIISGPSGVGKTTITRGVERGIGDSVFSVSYTTRAKTEADTEGVDYHFISDERFEELEQENAFLESADVFGKKYGTRKRWVDEQLARGRLVILEIDVLGAQQVKTAMPDAFAMFILPPSEEELLNRLQNRKRESEEQIQKRFAEAKREIAFAKESDVYDTFVINEDVDRAIAEAIEKVAQARTAQGK